MIKVPKWSSGNKTFSFPVVVPDFWISVCGRYLLWPKRVTIFVDGKATCTRTGPVYNKDWGKTKYYTDAYNTKVAKGEWLEYNIAEYPLGKNMHLRRNRIWKAVRALESGAALSSPSGMDEDDFSSATVVIDFESGKPIHPIPNVKSSATSRQVLLDCDGDDEEDVISRGTIVSREPSAIRAARSSPTLTSDSEEESEESESDSLETAKTQPEKTQFAQKLNRKRKRSPTRRDGNDAKASSVHKKPKTTTPVMEESDTSSSDSESDEDEIAVYKPSSVGSRALVQTRNANPVTAPPTAKEPAVFRTGVDLDDEFLRGLISTSNAMVPAQMQTSSTPEPTVFSKPFEQMSKEELAVVATSLHRENVFLRQLCSSQTKYCAPIMYGVTRLVRRHAPKVYTGVPDVSAELSHFLKQMPFTSFNTLRRFDNLLKTTSVYVNAVSRLPPD